MKDFLFAIFGDNATFLDWFVSLFFALLGFYLFKLVTYNRRTDKASSFNPRYWWRDNRIEVIIGAVLFYVLMRFHSDLLILQEEHNLFPIVSQNRQLFVLLMGALFTVLLKKMRNFFRTKEYANGNSRSSHVGSRPDDR